MCFSLYMKSVMGETSKEVLKVFKLLLDKLFRQKTKMKEVLRKLGLLSLILRFTEEREYTRFGDQERTNILDH